MNAPTFFIVKHDDQYYGPFLDTEACEFMTRFDARRATVLPLSVPRSPSETRGPLKVTVMNDVQTRSHEDGVKIDTRVALSGLLWAIFNARDEERVLTVDELLETWGQLFDVSQAIRSLMHHIEQVIDDPTPRRLGELRKAFWRNRGSDDVDPSYRDRFW